MLANEAPVISGSKPSADQLECTKETAMGHQLGQPRDRVWSAVSSFFFGAGQLLTITTLGRDFT